VSVAARNGVVGLTALLLAACADAPSSAVTSCEAEVSVGAAATDVLFVVDDSGSMREEQENLRQNLRAFVELLADAPIRNDFRIGVTTTSVSNGDGSTTYPNQPSTTRPDEQEPNAGLPFPAGAVIAVAQTAAGEPVDVWGRLVYDPALYPSTNGYGGARFLDAGAATLVPDFEANVLVGVAGSGRERPFAALRRALDARVADGTNAGFLRPGARLAIVIVTDEDDCTDPAGRLAAGDECHSSASKALLEPVGDVVAFLRGPLAGEARDPIVAVIAGFDGATLAPTGCGSSYDDPTRLDALLAALGPERSYKGSICDPDFGPGLQAIADLLVPQVVPLEGAPADPRLLVVNVVRGGETIACPLVPGCASPGSCGEGAVFTPAAGGEPAQLSFQGPCRLHAGDRIDVRVLCAG
jgi:hypothetical protein